MSDEVNDLLKGGASAFKFAEIGDTAKGVITKLETAQVIDYDTEKPKFYDDGKPIMQIVITIRQEDEEETRIFVKPAAKAAIRKAVEDAKAEKIEVGGRIAVKFSFEKPNENPKFKPIKQFEAAYEPPTKNISANDLLGD